MPAEVPILADATAALTALAELSPASNPTRADSRAPGLSTSISPPKPTRMMRCARDLRMVLEVIREALPAETIIASDMTQIAYAANEIFPMDLPRRWLHPAGFGTLGYALPAAIGAKAGRPELPTAVLVGDYGFQYTINELGTAAELGQPLVILLWNNDALGQIRDDMVNKGIQPNAVTLKNPDLATLPALMVAPMPSPKSSPMVGPAIAAALGADRPTIIEMTPRMLAR